MTKKLSIFFIVTLLTVSFFLPYSAFALDEVAQKQGPFYPNTMQQPTPEELQKAKLKLQKCILYCELKDSGHYEEAHELLMEMWPSSKTTVEDIEKSAITGEVIIRDFSLQSNPDQMIPFSEKERSNASKTIKVTHYPQSENYYCGPAAVRSIISSQQSIPPTQKKLANFDNLQTDYYGQTGFGNNLTKTLNAHMTTIGEYELGWGSIFTVQSLKAALKSTLDAGFPILANGVSGGSESYVTLSWYPSGTYHYVCVYGYSDHVDTIWVCDPAADSPALIGYGFDKVIPKYGYSVDLFYSFIKPRGIVY